MNDNYQDDWKQPPSWSQIDTEEAVTIDASLAKCGGTYLKDNWWNVYMEFLDINGRAFLGVQVGSYGVSVDLLWLHITPNGEVDG